MSIDHNFRLGPNAHNTPANYDHITYTVNENPEAGRCRLVINGHPCGSRSRARGLCPSHYQRLRKTPGLEKYGALKVGRGKAN